MNRLFGFRPKSIDRWSISLVYINTMYHLKSEKLRQLTKEYFNCFDRQVVGVPLNANRQFWCEKVMGNELMTNKVSKYSIFSIFTVEYFNALEWYKIERIKSEKFTFNQGKGPSILNIEVYKYYNITENMCFENFRIWFRY